MTALPDLLKSMLPPDVAFAAGRVEDARGELFAVEREAVARAVEKRRREFAAGRAYARVALGALGCPPQAIPVAPDRQAVWPVGYVGSISHTDRLCAAIVGRAEAYAGLGIDLEHDAPLKDDLRHMICRPEERGEAGVPGADAGKLVFVAKEAVFKAYYPATRTFLEFHDVAVAFDAPAQSFEARLVGDKPAVAGLRRFSGRFGRVDGHIVAVVVIARNDAPG
jgi:4'-phosphopantetheinyl transferase EntD